MAILKYKSSSGEIKDLKTVKIKGYSSLDDKYLVSCTNCVIYGNSQKRDLIQKGQHIYVIANQLGDKKFNYMQNQLKEIVSYNTVYDFYVHTDTFLEAIFSDTEVEKQDIVAWQGYELVPDSRDINNYLIIRVLEDETPQSYGMLIARTVDIPDEDMIIENAGSGTGITKNEQTLSERNIDVTYWSRMPAAAWQNHYHIKSRPFIRTLKNDEEIITYGKCMEIQL